MKNRPLGSICLVLAVIMCVCICVGKERFVKELRKSPLQEHVADGSRIRLEGQVYQKEIKEKYQILYLKNNSIYYQEQSFIEPRIIIYDEQKEEIHIGNKVQAEGEVLFYEPPRNPGNFDQKLYYQKQEIHGNVWAEELKVIGAEEALFREWLYEIRQLWKETLEVNAGQKEGAILAAMILGEKGGMDAKTKELYQVNGIGHIIAISGLHLSFVGIGIYQLLRKLSGSYVAGGAAGVLFLLLYVGMIGITVSVVRALVMYLFRVGADVAGRHYDSLTALLFALIVALVWRPLNIYDGGFWMSFLAVAAVVVVLPMLQEIMCCRKVFQGLLASGVIQIVLLPVLLYYFYEFPLYSSLLNVFIIPLMSVLLCLGMAGSILCIPGMPVMVLLVPMGNVMLKICGVILWIYEKFCEWMIKLPGARVVTGKPELWQVIVYYICLVLALAILWKCREEERQSKCVEKRSVKRNVKRAGKAKMMAALVIWIVGTAFLVSHFGEKDKLLVTVLDVGQGDGIFMRGPKGGAYLVDGGSSDVNKVGEYRIEPYLMSKGVGSLDYVFVSHGDEDHVSGIREMLMRQDVGVQIHTLVFPDEEMWDENLTELAVLAKKAGTRVVVMRWGQTIKEGELEILCLAPRTQSAGEYNKTDGGKIESAVEPGNEASMVLAVRYKAFDMLLTGDVEGEGELELRESIMNLCGERKFEVLKAAHHGSKNSSSTEFLSLVNPKYAIISAGRENSYGHPHQETIERLQGAGSTIYSTQDCGGIEITVELMVKIQYTLKEEFHKDSTHRDSIYERRN